jgi:membrane dipeptidase
MKFIDMHCDTLLMYMKPGGCEGLEDSGSRVSFAKLRQGGAMAQFFAMFLPPEQWSAERDLVPAEDDEFIRTLCAGFYADIDKCPYVSFAGNHADLIRNDGEGKISAYLAIEDGRSVGGDLRNIKKYYDLGVRLITLTWNSRNCFGSPNVKEVGAMNEGLTDFGKEAVQYMQELGMLVDVSHLSDGGFWDVAKICGKPFVASHSNSRSLTPVNRNLTDDMLKALGDCGSVTGINFGDNFMRLDTKRDAASIEDFAAHAAHITKHAGYDALALGSDFDGTKISMEANDSSKMQLLFAALKKAGFSESNIEKAAWRNAARVIKESMR